MNKLAKYRFINEALEMKYNIIYSYTYLKVSNFNYPLPYIFNTKTTTLLHNLNIFH